MRHPPFSRGVQDLMYVGDDAAAAAPTGLSSLSSVEKVVGAAGLYAAVATKGILRLAGIGAAAWVGYKAFGR